MTKTRSRFLHDRVEPFSPDPDLSPADILERMERISFQGRNLAAALRVWKKMLDEDVLIFLGVAGALSAGGLRVLIAHLLEQRYVDCLISTGANLYHDLHETRGRHHFIGSPHVDDAALHAEQIDRIYDTFVSEDEFIDNDNWIAAFAAELEGRPYSSREFLCLLGQRLWSATGRHGILTAAYRAKVPVFCPGIADSSIGMALSQARHERSGTGQMDVIGDVIESSNLVIRKPRTACVLLGGGTPKNFLNQASVQAAFFRPGIEGHALALQIVTDTPDFGGASGALLDEAKSWGKLARDADQVTVRCDATIALPFLVTALTERVQQHPPKRTVPQFEVEHRRLSLDGAQLSGDRFDV